MFVRQLYAVILILAASAAPNSSCSKTYKVKKGDSCIKISQEQHVSTDQLFTANPAVINKDCTNLEVGETICLSLAQQSCSATEIVAAGSTCQSIADKNGLTLADLRQSNPQLDQACDIMAGEVLCVSKMEQAPSNGPQPKSSPNPPPPPRTSSKPTGITLTFPQFLTKADKVVPTALTWSKHTSTESELSCDEI